MSRDYNCTIAVKANPTQTFHAICDIPKWWATNFEGRAQIAGDRFTVRFGKTYSVIKVSESDPGKKLAWIIEESYLPLFKNPAQWNNTRIVWEIVDKNDTEITMTHMGLTPETDCYCDCEKGWNFYIGESLKKLVTDGIGCPGTGIFSNISHDGRRYAGLLYFKNDPLPDYVHDYFFIDVKETKGEEVLSAYKAAAYDKKNFDPGCLMGEYFMVVENKPLVGGILPLHDILEMINNSKMENKNYHRQLTLDKNAQDVLDEISQVSDWWAKDLTGSSVDINDVFTVHFGETFVTFQVTELVPGKTLVWHVNDCNLPWQKDKKEWTDTEVVWEVSPKNGSTQVDFTHVGLIPEVECYDNCVKGWDFYLLESLKKLITEGQGLPHTPKSSR